jgi:hypothetical protein
MKEDGACLFRAVADHIYGDEEMHSVVRNHCMDYIVCSIILIQLLLLLFIIMCLFKTKKKG